MDMDLDDAALSECDDAVSDGLEVFEYDRRIKCIEICLRPLQAHQHLGAVAVLEDAVLCKEIEVEVASRRGYIDFTDTHILVRECPEHALDYVDKTRSAAVDDSRLLQYIEHSGSLLEGALRLLEKIGEHIKRRCVLPCLHIFRRTAHDGKHGSLRRLHDCLVCVLRPALESPDESAAVGLLDSLEGICYSLEYLGENDA